LGENINKCWGRRKKNEGEKEPRYKGGSSSFKKLLQKKIYTNPGRRRVTGKNDHFLEAIKIRKGELVKTGITKVRPPLSSWGGSYLLEKNAKWGSVTE